MELDLKMVCKALWDLVTDGDEPDEDVWLMMQERGYVNDTDWIADAG
jgi:hypothetical protein